MKKLLVATMLGLFSVSAFGQDVPMVTTQEDGRMEVRMVSIPEDPEGWLTYLCLHKKGEVKAACMTFGKEGRVATYRIVLKELDT